MLNHIVVRRSSSTVMIAVTLFIAILVVMLSFSAAQVLYGTLTGNVTDPSGAAVASAKVEALNEQTGVVQQAVTDESGIFRFLALQAGTYKITVAAANFDSVVTERVRVDANAVRRVDTQLKVAKQQESVTVTAEAPILQTDKADVHTDLQATHLQNLPNISSEGRSFQALYKIIPGFGLPVENNSAGGNPERAMTANVNGQSSQGNSTRIDGVLDAYPWLPNNVAYVPPIDAIETVNVVTNSYDAEQGNAGGAAVNVQIKSGTNTFHGSAHEFHTDNVFKAYNYFTPPTTRKPLNVFNQFGGQLGGPIKKDKLFFFADWERTAQRLAGARTLSIPTDAERNGDFRGLLDSQGNPVVIYDPNTGNADGTGRSQISCNAILNTICPDRIDPASATMLGLIPEPNVAGAADSSNYFISGTSQFNRDNVDAKVNYVASQKSTVFGRYSISRVVIIDPPSLGAAGGEALNGGQTGRAGGRIQSVGLGGTYSFSPHVLLDVNAGYTRQRINAEAFDIGENFGLDTLHIPGTNGPDREQGGQPAFQVSTTSSWSNLGNPNTGNPFLFRDNQYVANANLSWITGRHGLRFGVEYSRTGINHFQPQGGNFQTARGSFRFGGSPTQLNGGPGKNKYNELASFLLGLPSEVGKVVQNVNPIALRFTGWAWYARDQWQVTPKLTVNYGVRWEYYPMATSDHGGARVLDPSTMNVLIGGNGGVPLDEGVDVGSGQFLPRLGIAYRPASKTVIRAGYGMSADPNNYRFLRNAFPAVTISDFNGVGGNAFAPAGSLTGTNATGAYASIPIGITEIPLPDISSGVIPLPNGVGTTTLAKNFRRGYINSFNAMFQQEFAGFVGEIGYVGTRGIRPLTNMNINPAPVGGGQAGRILSAAFAPRSWSDINQLTPFGNNYYDAMQSKLTRRFGGSLIGVAYTLSKATDYEDNEEINFLLFPYPAYWPRNKATAGFDRTHNFQAYGVYELPFGRGQRWGQSGVWNAIGGGWQLNGVLSVLSGTPFTITADGTYLNAPGNTQTADIVGPIHILNGQPRPSTNPCQASDLSCHYFDPSSFALPPTSAAQGPPRFGTAGRNVIEGPGYFNLDMSLYRNFKITERFTFQFQAQAFGVTNTPHFNNPGSNISGANFGIVTSTLTTTNASLGGSGGERQWWFGGKLIF